MIFPDDDYPDFDREEAAAEARWQRRRNRGCQCGPDLPGTCPGVENCPNSGYEHDED